MVYFCWLSSNRFFFDFVDNIYNLSKAGYWFGEKLKVVLIFGLKVHYSNSLVSLSKR